MPINTRIDIENRKALQQLNQVQRAADKLQNSSIDIKVKANPPLGKITGQINEFEKSLAASNARVLAFGATTGVIVGLQQAFKGLVRNIVDVELALAKVNVILQASSSNFAKFSQQLFDVANNTGSAFSVAAEAAGEFARQGLSLSQTMEATNAALILVRISGIEATQAVEALTAASNTFNQEGLKQIDIVNKLANVDAAFATSAEGLAEGIRRVGGVATDAGVNLDQLLALIAALQQRTARGEAVIGNGLKTIFARVSRTSVLDQLEELGLKVRESTGEAKSAITILSDLANKYDDLSSAQKSQVSESVAGVFQLNTFKSLMKDLSSETSFYSQALKTSANSTDEAEQRNAQLNNTLSALFNQLSNNAVLLSKTLGDSGLAEPIKKLAQFINNTISKFTELIQESTLFQTILKGVSNILTGPGLVAGVALLTKLFANVVASMGGAFSVLLGMNSKQQLFNQLVQQNVGLIRNEKGELLSALQIQRNLNTAVQGELAARKQIQILARQYAPGIAVTNKNARKISGNFAGGSVPLGTALGREQRAINMGVGGASPNAKPVIAQANLGKGNQVVVINSDEKLVRNFGGTGKDAVLTKNMMSGNFAFGTNVYDVLEEAMRTSGNTLKVKFEPPNPRGTGFEPPRPKQTLNRKEKIDQRKRQILREAAERDEAAKYRTFFGPPTGPSADILEAIEQDNKNFKRDEILRKYRQNNFLTSGLPPKGPRKGLFPGVTGQSLIQGPQTLGGQLALGGAGLGTPLLAAGLSQYLGIDGGAGNILNSVGGGIGTALVGGSVAGVAGFAGGAFLGGIQVFDTIVREAGTSLEELSKKTEELTARNTEVINSTNAYIQATESFKSLIEKGGRNVDFRRVSSQRRDALNAIPDAGIRQQLRATGMGPNSQERQEEILQTYQENAKIQQNTLKAQEEFRKSVDQRNTIGSRVSDAFSLFASGNVSGALNRVGEPINNPRLTSDQRDAFASRLGSGLDFNIKGGQARIDKLIEDLSNTLRGSGRSGAGRIIDELTGGSLDLDVLDKIVKTADKDSAFLEAVQKSFFSRNFQEKLTKGEEKVIQGNQSIQNALKRLSATFVSIGQIRSQTAQGNFNIQANAARNRLNLNAPFLSKEAFARSESQIKEAELEQAKLRDLEKINSNFVKNLKDTVGDLDPSKRNEALLLFSQFNKDSNPFNLTKGLSELVDDSSVEKQLQELNANFRSQAAQTIIKADKDLKIQQDNLQATLQNLDIQKSINTKFEKIGVGGVANKFSPIGRDELSTIEKTRNKRDFNFLSRAFGASDPKTINAINTRRVSEETEARKLINNIQERLTLFNPRDDEERNRIRERLTGAFTTVERGALREANQSELSGLLGLFSRELTNPARISQFNRITGGKEFRAGFANIDTQSGALNAFLPIFKQFFGPDNKGATEAFNRLSSLINSFEGTFDKAGLLFTGRQKALNILPDLDQNSNLDNANNAQRRATSSLERQGRGFAAAALSANIADTLLASLAQIQAVSGSEKGIREGIANILEDISRAENKLNEGAGTDAGNKKLQDQLEKFRKQLEQRQSQLSNNQSMNVDAIYGLFNKFEGALEQFSSGGDQNVFETFSKQLIDSQTSTSENIVASNDTLADQIIKNSLATENLTKVLSEDKTVELIQNLTVSIDPSSLATGLQEFAGQFATTLVPMMRDQIDQALVETIGKKAKFPPNGR